MTHSFPTRRSSELRRGLRAGDIRDMRREDIEWRSGHLKVVGKTRRPDRLPLPQDVGDAILAYLAAARPTAIEAHLFLRSQAPFRPFSSSAEIAGIVARPLDRGGIEGLPTGSHIFSTDERRVGKACVQQCRYRWE